MITEEMIQEKVQQLEMDKDIITGEEIIKRNIEICDLTIEYYTERVQHTQEMYSRVTSCIKRATSENYAFIPQQEIDDLLTGLIIDKAKIASLETFCYQKIAECRQLAIRLNAELD